METKPTSVFVNPGASGISKMVANLLKKAGVKPILLVRNEECVKLLKTLGHEIILNTADPNFDGQLAEVIKALNPTVFVDSVVNEISTKIFMMMPRESTHLVIGGLGGNQVVSTPLFPLLMSDKVVKGYYWSYEDFVKPKAEIRKELDSVNEDLAKGGKLYGIPKVAEYKLADFKKAIEEQHTYASKGAGVIYFHK